MTKKITLDLHSITDKASLFACLHTLIDFEGNNFDALHDALGDICKKTRIDVVGTSNVHEDFIGVLTRVLADSADENAKLSVLFK